MRISNATTRPQASPKRAPIVLGMGKCCHVAFQSRMTTKEEINAPMRHPKVERARVKDKGVFLANFNN